MAVEDVVAEDQAAGLAGEEVAADDKSLGEAVGRGLDSVLERETPTRAIANTLSNPRPTASPRSCSKRGVSSGVEMMRMSRMPESIRMDKG
jgi:hypothetical protein